MREKIKIELLSARLFVIGLVILLANDFVFKALFHNALTGKISDFAGLFIFSYFFSVFFLRHTKLIYLITGILFVVWKSPLSDSFIIWWNHNLFFQISRVVDYTDLLALAVLPVSYFYLKKQSIPKSRIRFVYSYLIGAIAFFSFCATSQPRQRFDLKIETDKKYSIPISKSEVFNQLSYRYGYSDTIEKNLIDSMFYCYFDIPEKWTSLTAIVTITEINDKQTNLQLDSVIAFDVTGGFFTGIDEANVEFVQSLSANDFEDYFEQNYINVILKKNTISRNSLFFDNKELLDKYIKEITVANKPQ